MLRLPVTLARVVALVLPFGVAVAAAAPAAICNVPSAGYPTLAAALADSTCDPIQVAAGTLTENLLIDRDVALAGAGSGSTTILGWVQVIGSPTSAVLDALRIDASAAISSRCYASGLDARGGGFVSGFDLVVVGHPTPTSACGFFSDGFESGDTVAWSSRAPS